MEEHEKMSQPGGWLKDGDRQENRFDGYASLNHDRLFALGAVADVGHGGAGELAEAGEVGAGVFG